MTNAQKIIRWLLFIPAACVFSVLAFWAIYYLQFNFIDDEGIYAKYILPIYATAISSVIFMLTVAEVVPSSRETVITTMFGVMLAVTVWGLITYFRREEWFKFVMSIGSLFGLFYGFISGKEMAEKGERFFKKQV